jgi:hypothetical protein
MLSRCVVWAAERRAAYAAGERQLDMAMLTVANRCATAWSSHVVVAGRPSLPAGWVLTNRVSRCC